MTTKRRFLTTSQIANRLGTSAKALRLYEKRGLLAPSRSLKGWRLYDPHDIDKAAQIVRLRKLGLALSEIQDALDESSRNLELALDNHCNSLIARISELQSCIAEVQQLKQELRVEPSTNGTMLPGKSTKTRANTNLTISLPWPWDREQFEIPSPGPINFITGPLASGKTQLAKAIAAELDNGEFIGLDRTDRTRVGDQPRSSKLQISLAKLQARGAVINDALEILLEILETKTESILVFDLLEQNLTQASQEALMHYLRDRAADAAPIFAMTRSSTILNVAEIERGERIIFRPANHSPPMLVESVPGSIGYEAMNSCLATPSVRARSAGVVAMFDRSIACLATN